VKNRALAEVFAEIADLMEIVGEDPFRVNSYRKVVRTLENLSEDILASARARPSGSSSFSRRARLRCMKS